jgi:hypothetical protein
MRLAAYEIVGREGDWCVAHDGKIEGCYATKEAAFEAAAAAASNAIKVGYEVRLHVPGADGVSPALGTS